MVNLSNCLLFWMRTNSATFTRLLKRRGWSMSVLNESSELLHSCSAEEWRWAGCETAAEGAGLPFSALWLAEGVGCIHTPLRNVNNVKAHRFRCRNWLLFVFLFLIKRLGLKLKLWSTGTFAASLQEHPRLLKATPIFVWLNNNPDDWLERLLFFRTHLVLWG